MGFDGKVLEEVRTFKYLGFTFQRNGNFTQHLEQLASAAKRALAKTWSIGERKSGDNFMIRKQKFYILVVPVMTFGCEVFG